MNFNELYSRLFVSEADTAPLDIDQQDPEQPEASGRDVSNIPVPDNYDVEPMPTPVIKNNTPELQEYITKLNDFLTLLNGIGNKSLQKFVAEIDIPNTVLSGISKQTAQDVTRLAEQVASLIQTLQSSVNLIAIRKREISNNIPR